MKSIDLTKLKLEESKLLNDASREIRYAFNELITNISLQHRDNIYWHLTSVASRNTYLSNMFLWCCQLAMIRNILQSEVDIDQIKTDSKGMKNVLERYLKKNNYKIKVCYNLSIWQRIKKYLTPILYLGDTLLYIFKTYTYSKIIRRKDPYDYPQPITLLDCFVLKSSFPEDSNIYIDRYYTGFMEYIKEDEKKSIYYLPEFIGIKDYKATFKKIRCSENNFIIKEDYLKVKDYIRAVIGMLMTPFRAFKVKSFAAQFLDFNVLPLVYEETKLKCTIKSSVKAVLNYLFIKRLAQRGIEVRLVIDWNENQIIDRALIKGVHDFIPQTQVIGYQGFIISPQYHIYIHPTQYEYSLGLIPDKIAVVGEGLINRTKEFCPDLQVIKAPAGRFQKIWQNNSANIHFNTFRILLPLPITKIECQKILHTVNKSLKLISIFNVEVLVKQHPTYNQEDILRNYGSDWPVEFTFVKGDFHDLLQGSNLVVGNTSSVCVESIAKGIPVIILGNGSGLTQNPIPEEIKENIWTLCYTPEEVAKSIEFYIKRSNEQIQEHVNIGKTIRKEYFEPITREGVRKFLNFND